MPNPDDPKRAEHKDGDEIDRFLFSLLATPSQVPDSSFLPPPLRELGTTPLARQLGLADEQTNGHWCSRCQGIWYGYTLEVECPVCGNRKG
ncbi:conserved hypothetical protein [Nitrospira defluvii]|uniref:Uncharacterized protein n=2 Tax=Nitrospira TaxID=1234 RepID=A0AA86T4M3_9BACT|nr:conserved hypothetical protein [Nitrospira defluvii]CAI4031576.1 hypothetical protein DNFV4_01996 [Nitrospira tepida]